MTYSNLTDHQLQTYLRLTEKHAKSGYWTYDINHHLALVEESKRRKAA